MAASGALPPIPPQGTFDRFCPLQPFLKVGMGPARPPLIRTPSAARIGMKAQQTGRSFADSLRALKAC
jgi:hypothetical protein